MAAPLSTNAPGAVNLAQPTFPAQSTLFPGTAPTNATAASTTAANAPSSKTLPAHLQLDLDHAILKVGETANVTLAVFSDGALNAKGLQLLHDLPNGLATTGGVKGKLRWDVPALALGEAFRQVVPITIDKPKQALKQGVLTLQATLSAPSADSLSTTRLLGVAPTTPAPETQATIDGAVLQNGTGDVVLLVKPGAVKEGVTFRYTELRRVPRAKTNNKAQAPQVAPITVLTPTRPVTIAQTGMSNWLYLPLANAGAGNAQVQAAAQLTDTTGVTGTVPPTATVQPVSDHNVDAYAIWQLDAQLNGTRVPTFTEEVQLVVSLAPWLAAGVPLESLNLWTRESDTERWVLVRSEYDAETKLLSAWLPHFSQFTLAQGLNNADVLPSVRAFSTDRTTGGATLHYPIEAPQGLGGLSPNLSLNYSSVSVDDLYLDGGDTGFTTQVSGVGIGWEVGGISRIVRTDNKLDKQTVYSDRDYAMTLNGTFVRIHYQDKAWRTDPEIFAQITRNGSDDGGLNDYTPWTITTADGVKYTFGDPNANGAWSATTATAFFIERNSATDQHHYRLAKEWYLTKVEDRLGNQLVYNYRAEQWTHRYCNTDGLGWYVRAIYPTDIYWSGNPAQGVASQMHIGFAYSSAERDDWNIQYAEAINDDCKEVKYARLNQLQNISVQVNASGWQTLRSYQLSQAYNTPNANTARRLMLTGIDQKGKNGTVLNHYSFTYNCTPGACAALVNTIRLLAANNGWGGQINYTYTGHQPSVTNSVCNNHCTRSAVTRTDVQDGLGNSVRTDYYYGPPTSAGGSPWAMISDAREFAGFRRSEATYYAINTTNIVKWDAIDTWQGQKSNPDPRRGRIQQQEVRTGPGGTLLAVTVNNWNAYKRLIGDWDSGTTISNAHQEGTDYIYDTLWVRLDATSEWTAGAGKFTQNFYERTRQNNQQFGNLTQVEEWSHAATAINYSATWTTDNPLQLLRKTTTEYFPNSSLNIVNKPARVRVYNGSGACLAETRTVYLDYADVQHSHYKNYQTPPVTGVIAKTEQAINSCSETADINARDTAWTVTFFDADGYGNQTTVYSIGAAADASQDDHLVTIYDATYHLFPIQQYKNQNSAFQETAAYYGVNGLGLGDAKAFWGARQEYCAVNEVCTRQSYDEFGRRVYRWDYTPKGSAWATNANASVQYSYIPYGGAQTTTTIAEWHNPRSEGNFTRRLYNGLGQLVQEQTPYQGWSTTGGQEILVGHAYDAFGQPTQVSVPHLVATYSSGNIYRGASYAAGVTTTAYDALGRPTQTTAPNGELTFYGYNGRSSDSYTKDRTKTDSQADAYRINQWQELDGLGYVANSRTWTYNGSWSWTQNAQVTFTHDATGNLTSVTHPNSIGATTMGYDLLGHKTSMNDVDLGSWSYAYDRQGKLTRQTDARNQTTCLYYENVLERVSGKYFTTGTSCPASVSSYNTTFWYDTNHGVGNRSRGQLTYISTGQYDRFLTYNDQGLLFSERIGYPSAPQYYYTYHYYDAYQRPSALNYPDGESVSTTYNSMGLANKLNSNWYGDLVDGTTASGSVPNGVNYDEAGRLRYLRFPLGGNLWRVQVYQPWTSSNSYSPHSWPVAMGDSNGRLQYIAIGTQPGWGDRAAIEYQYDGFGNVLRTGDWDTVESSESAYTYDAQNRLINGYNLPYSYDSAGRLTNYENTGYTGYRGHGVTSSGGAQRTYYDANGNMANRRWGLGNQQSLNWDAENHLSWIGGSNGYAEAYLYDADGQRVRSNNSIGGYTFYVGPHYEVTSDVAWVDEAVPGGATVMAADDGWVWENGNPASGAGYHRSPAKAGLHQHYFYGATQPLKVNTGDVLYAYVYLDSTNPPSELMFQWYDSSSGWEHRAYWGQNLIAAGTDGTNSRRYLGALPTAGGWVRLEIPAAQVGLQGVNVTGMAFTLYNGQAWWDRAGKRSNSWLTTKYYTFNGQRIALRDETGLYYLHQDQLGSTLLVTNGSGVAVDGHGYYAYGRDRRGSELRTAQRFTGQQQDGTGLVYMNARYYDPQLGQFISPDTLVPDATNVMDFNRYLYARGNPMKYNDPSGHCIWDLCIVEGIGAVELLSAAAGVAAYYGYVASPAGQAAIANAGQALDNLNANQAPQPPQEAVPLPVPAKPQISGTPLNTDDAPTIGATAPLADSNTMQLLSDPLPAQQKGSNLVSARQYAPSSKHARGGWGTSMDLSDSRAQEVLNNGIEAPNGKQVYGYYKGQLYEFMPDNVGGYHGYPIPGNQAPIEVLRTMRDQSMITNAQYNKLLQGK